MTVARHATDVSDGKPTPGAALRAIRKEKGLSTRDVARASGFTVREITAVERGRRELTLDDFRSLAGSLSVDLSTLVLVEPHEGGEDGRVDAQIDSMLESAAASDLVGTVPMTVADLPPSTPLVIPSSERRRDRRTRQRVERAWDRVAGDLEAVRAACRRLATAGSTDDAGAIVDMLRTALEQLEHNRAFVRHAEAHRSAIAKARSIAPGTTSAK